MGFKKICEDIKEIEKELAKKDEADMVKVRGVINDLDKSLRELKKIVQEQST